MAEESIFAKKPKEAKAKKPTSVLDQPTPTAPTKAEVSAAAPAKTGGKTGLIVTIIILAAALVAAGIVLTIVLINQNKGEDKKEDDKVSIIKDDKKDDDKKGKKDDKKTNDNPTIVEGDHVRGKRDSKVAIVEYADPQCPGCASMMPVMDAIYEEYGDQVAFIYRHYPLSYHKHAIDAIQAVEAAGEQGYFWEMLSAVFDNQIDWEYEDDEDDLLAAFVEIFEDIAEDGNVTSFKKAYKNNDYSDKIAADKQLGVKDKLSATPTIIVNGKTITLSGTYASLKQTIINEIKAGL